MTLARLAVLHWVAVAGLLVLLAILLFAKLRAAGYPRALAAVLSAIALLHPAFADPATGLISVLFALTAYAMAASGLSFAHRPDPRRTILLSSSLAGAQLVNPICGMLSAISMPLALRNSLVSGQTARTFGQIVSVLFIPVLIAVLLMSVAIGQHDRSPFWNSDGGPHLLDGGKALMRSALVIAPLAISLIAVGGKRRGICETIGGLCLVLLATGVLDGLLGVTAAPDVTSAVGPLAAIVLSTTEAKDARPSGALLLIAASIIACWFPVDRIASFAGV